MIQSHHKMCTLLLRNTQVHKKRQSIQPRYSMSSVVSGVSDAASKSKRFSDLSYESGMPVMVRVNARLVSMEIEQFIATGSEDGKATAWQYNMTTDQIENSKDMVVGRHDSTGTMRRRSSVTSSVLKQKNHRLSRAHRASVHATSQIAQLSTSRRYFMQTFTQAVTRCARRLTAQTSSTTRDT